MASIKTYQLKDGNSTKSAKRIDVGGKSRMIIFESKRRDGNLLFSTADSKVQKGLEESKYFENETVTVISEKEIASVLQKPAKAKKKAAKPEPVVEEDPDDEDMDEDPDDENPDEELTEIEGVTTLQKAKEALRGEPWNVAAGELKNAEMILNKAAELGVSFPNLKQH
jgi:hypothetical protein